MPTEATCYNPSRQDDGDGEAEAADANVEDVDGGEAGCDEDEDVLREECGAGNVDGAIDEDVGHGSLEVVVFEAVKVASRLELCVGLLFAGSLDQEGQTIASRVGVVDTSQRLLSVRKTLLHDQKVGRLEHEQEQQRRESAHTPLNRKHSPKS